MEPAARRRPAFKSGNAAASSDDLQTLSALIANIFDAALDRSLWEGVIERTAHFVGGIGASLFTKEAPAAPGDVQHRLGKLHCDAGIDPYYRRLYFEKYIAFD